MLDLSIPDIYGRVFIYFQDSRSSCIENIMHELCVSVTLRVSCRLYFSQAKWDKKMRLTLALANLIRSTDLEAGDGSIRTQCPCWCNTVSCTPTGTKHFVIFIKQELQYSFNRIKWQSRETYSASGRFFFFTSCIPNLPAWLYSIY